MIGQQGGFRRRAQTILLGGALLFGFAATYPHVLVAQSPEEADGPVRVGDRWVYDTKDEITGFPKETYAEIVTEVSPKEIVVNLTWSGTSTSAIITYDHDWNRLDNSINKFKPSDGQGIRLPLSVGKEWRSEFDAKNLRTGVNTRGSNSSKVVAQETLTTPAGTFETLKIDRRVREFNTSDPSKLWEVQTLLWYAPQINHWVRRTTLVKFEKRARSHTSEELADFTRNL
jgi:hypothetical protein